MALHRRPEAPVLIAFQGVNARQSQPGDYVYQPPPPPHHQPSMHVQEHYPDPRMSAQHTNQALDTLTSVRSYPQPGRPMYEQDHYHQQASHDYGRDAHYSHSGPTRVYDNHRFDPVAYNQQSRTNNNNNAHYNAREPHDLYRHDSFRHHSSSPVLYRNMQEMPSHSMSSARHQCTYCGKRFSRPSGLRVCPQYTIHSTNADLPRQIHITTHTGEKPYVCPEDGCRRSFSVRSNMRRHVRIVHHVEMPAGTSGTSPSSSGGDLAEDED